ncbi:predicted protein [Coccidioides posadasii str. Silveira]|uniref:Predicted protein n=1 Tax=Coccidioides posadasii (strain RMSCC 757 / Silveira) TaxID=443226 RepID=E9D888_COCPS|nr:predicted protein [Coccidioides posadasii str. Silveira]
MDTPHEALLPPDRPSLSQQTNGIRDRHKSKGKRILSRIKRALCAFFCYRKHSHSDYSSKEKLQEDREPGKFDPTLRSIPNRTR